MMSPRTEQQFEKIRTQRRERILKVALELFAKNGYHATSISMISAKAKISKGLMYNYFRSKEELLKQISETILQELIGLMSGVEGERDPLVKIEKIVKLSVQHLKENTSVWRLYLLLLQQSEVAKRMMPVFIKFRNEAIDQLATIFKELNSPDPVMDAYSLGIQLDGIGLNYLAAPKDLPVDKIVNHIISHYKNQVKRK